MSGTVLGGPINAGGGANYNMLLQGQQQPNGGFIGQAAQMMGIQAQQNANQLFQQQNEARVAIGPILQRAIGPDGKLSMDKAFAELATNPKTAFTAMEFINQAVLRQQTQMATAKTELDLRTQQFQNYGTLAGTLLPLKDKVDQGVLARTMADGVAAGTFPREMMEKVAANAPAGGQPLYEWLQRMHLMAMGAAKSGEMITGQISSHNTGQTTDFVKTVPYMGTAQNIGSIPNTPTVEQANALQSGKDSQGRPTLQRNYQIAPMLGGGGVVPGTGPQMTPGAPIPPAGPVVMGPGPVTEEGLKHFGEYAPKIESAAADAQRSMGVLDEQMELLKKFRSGATADIRLQLSRWAKDLGMNDKTVGALIGSSDKEALAAMLEFQKLAVGNIFRTISQAMHNVEDGAGGGLGRMTQGEFQKVGAEGIANLTADPAANKKIIDFMRFNAMHLMLEQKILQERRFTPQGQERSDFTPLTFRGTYRDLMSKSRLYQFNPQSIKTLERELGLAGN